jgi:hypothetical protein
VNLHPPEDSGLVWFNRWEERGFNEGGEGEVRREVLIIFMFGSREGMGGEVSDFNYIYVLLGFLYVGIILVKL